ncbi:SAF domain-containing protein [Cryptosporangium phraense]|uniref:SAF domain-containing protein n=1 Tax=Cryptosporangium phraense TaxID=2593070 RepID=A0A545ANR4_9ACTN|nr:SAF domain-containing protein [Cryptosporangium phraense]TQS42891.1 hypothetical protein FL583_22885 [Cryptosporangium phraense]
MSVPVSPPALRRRVPSWVDFRFLLGLLLVVGSVLGGARLFAVADDTVRVWAVARDLGAGTVLSAGDLVGVRVRLPESSGLYLAADGAGPVGRPLARDVGAGELLPKAAVAGRTCGSEVSVPVSAEHAPATLRRGVRVDVFATPRGGETVRVLVSAAVQGVSRESGIAGGVALVLRVPDEVAAGVVRAVRTSEIDVVVVSGRGADLVCGAAPVVGSSSASVGGLPEGVPSEGGPSGGEPSGGEPSGGEPSGGEPSGVEPSGVQPSGGGPSGGGPVGGQSAGGGR